MDKGAWRAALWSRKESNTAEHTTHTYKVNYIQVTLEQQGFELCGSTYMGVFSQPLCTTFHTIYCLLNPRMGSYS